MHDEEDLGWAQTLVDDHAVVMHVETRTVGRVEELYDGQGKLYTPPGEGARPVKHPVLKLDRGHTFVAKAGSFVRFEPREASYFQDVQAAIAGTLGEVAQLGAAKGVQGPTAFLLMAAALRQQLRELERLHPTSRPPADAH
jgi:hypothetical protein